MQLREYQLNSIENLRQGFRNNHIRQVLCAPTAAGKSIIMMAMIDAANKKNTRSLFICERRILVEQFANHLEKFGLDFGVYMAKSWRYRPNCNIQLASIQTLERMDEWPEVDLIFVDEIHACLRKSLINYINQNPDIKVVGATATPFHSEISKYFSEVTTVSTMNRLVQDKHLTPFRVFISHEIETKGIRIVAGEFQKDELEKRCQKIVGDVVQDYVDISLNVFGDYKKTICFAAGVQHGSELMKEFNQRGINAVQVSYKDSDEFKQEVFAEFKKPDTEIKMLISSTILERGADFPDVQHVILAKPFKKSFSSFVQQVGRGARVYTGKEFCVIQDNSGNWLRFNDSWEDLYYNGVTSLNSDVDNKKRKEPTKKEKEEAKCPKCSAFWPPKTELCSNCGFVHAHKKTKIINIQGEILELNGKNEKYPWPYKREFYQQMLGYCEQHKKHPGAARHWYKSKFKEDYPSDVIPNSLPPSIEVSNYCKSRLIAYAYGKRKHA